MVSRQQTVQIAEIIDLVLNSWCSPVSTRKYQTSKHHLITGKNLDQKHCFSTTNGPSEVDHDMSQKVFFLEKKMTIGSGSRLVL